MPHIKKAHAGNDTFGNTWDQDGAVVEVSHEQSVELLAIADAGFTLVSDPEVDGNDAGSGVEFSEVDPKAGSSDPDEDQAPAAAKKTAARKTAASKPE